MKKQYSTVLVALIGLLALSVGAEAQQGNKVVAKVPYEFVAGGKTFPAGTYTITRVSPETQRVLEIHNNETLAEGALLLPISSADAVDHVELSFERVEDTYYLNRIATPAGVFSLAKPKAMSKVATKKQPNVMS